MEELRRNIASREISGEEFSVRVYRQGLRYFRGGKQLTLYTEMHNVTSVRGRKWLVLPRVVTVVYVPVALSWDDGEPIDARQADSILSDLTWAVKEYGGGEWSFERSEEFPPKEPQGKAILHKADKGS